MLYLIRKNRLRNALGVLRKNRLRNALGVSKHRRRVSKSRRKNGVTAYTKEEHQKSLFERRKDIIINFLFEQKFIPENTIVASKEKVLELLELYQKIQSKKWSNSIYKRRTPEEFILLRKEEWQKSFCSAVSCMQR